MFAELTCDSVRERHGHNNGSVFESARGSLIIIGGHEDKRCDREILKEVARRVGQDGMLAICAAASSVPGEVTTEYVAVFRRLGLRHIHVVDIPDRAAADNLRVLKKVESASVLFFTGGDQFRMTRRITGTKFHDQLLALYTRGGTIVGTSAGAAAMSDFMLLPHASEAITAHRGMTPGLALLSRITIDTHFAERGRIGRLLGAVAQNQQTLGIGIGENAAVVVEADKSFSVVGPGAVFVVDGSGITCAGYAHGRDMVQTIFDARVHVLGSGDRFCLKTRRPILGPCGRKTQAQESTTEVA